MGDQFNMSMPGEPQIGLPGNHMLDRIKQESGVEMQWGWAAAAFGAQLIGGISKRNQAKRAKKSEEAWLQKKYDEYDLPMWKMNKDKLVAHRDEIIRGIELQQRNEIARAEFQDKKNLRQYQYALKIRDIKYQNELKLKERSDFFTDAAQKSAKELTALDEIQTNKMYQAENEENLIEGLIQKGQARAKGTAGVSAAKAFQSQLAAEGRQMEIITENIITAKNDGRMRLNDFLLESEAGRMLDPSKGLAPLKPMATPITEYELPRELEEYDFGPQPIKGVSQTQVPSMLGTIAGAVSKGATVMANNYSGTSNFDSTGFGSNTYGGHSAQDYYSNPSNLNTWGSFTETKIGF